MNFYILQVLYRLFAKKRAEE